MKVFFINPNSDEKMTAAIQTTAEMYNPGSWDIECRATPGAPEFIETYEDMAAAGPGHKFSILTTDYHSIPIHAELVRKYGMYDSLASIRAPEIGSNGDLLAASAAAVNQDKAEVIVLGCAGMTGLDKKLQAELGVPVLDGVVCALFIAVGLARYRVT